MGRPRTRQVENRSNLFRYNSFYIKAQGPSTVLHSFPQAYLT